MCMPLALLSLYCCWFGGTAGRAVDISQISMKNVIFWIYFQFPFRHCLSFVLFLVLTKKRYYVEEEKNTISFNNGVCNGQYFWKQKYPLTLHVPGKMPLALRTPLPDPLYILVKLLMQYHLRVGIDNKIMRFCVASIISTYVVYTNSKHFTGSWWKKSKTEMIASVKGKKSKHARG